LLDQAEQLLERQALDLQARQEELQRFRQRIATASPTPPTAARSPAREWELWQQRQEVQAEHQRLEQQIRQVTLETQRKARRAA